MRASATRRPIVAIVDVKSQAYGYREELLGIHLACAAAVDALCVSSRCGASGDCADRRTGDVEARSSRTVIEANRIVALDAPGTMVHAMGKEAAARVTRRTVEALDALGETIVPMSYSMSLVREARSARSTDRRYRRRRAGRRADRARAAGVVRTDRQSRAPAAARLRVGCESAAAQKNRAASIEVRRRLAEQWDAA